jgi:MoxR-like ATPase
MPMNPEHEARVEEIHNRLLDRKQRIERGEPVEEYDAEQALKDLYGLFEDDDEVDEFVRAVHEWRGYGPDCIYIRK